MAKTKAATSQINILYRIKEWPKTALADARKLQIFKPCGTTCILDLVSFHNEESFHEH